MENLVQVGYIRNSVRFSHINQRIFVRREGNENPRPLYLWSKPQQSEAYILLVINDGIVAIEGNRHEGMTAPPPFRQLLRDRGEAVGDFKDIRGLDDSAPTRITFLHQ